MHINKEISELIAKERLYELTADEQAILNRWINKSSFNKVCYERLTSGRSFANYTQWADQTHMDHVVTTIKHKIVEKEKKRLKARFVWLGSVAAFTLLLIGSSWLIENQKSEKIPLVAKYTMVSNDTSNQVMLTLSNGERLALAKNQPPIVEEKMNMESGTTRYHTIDVPKYGEYTFTLSDGTKVWLNAETTITYPIAFTGNKREVYLNGEAYFEVQSDSTKPFFIHSNEQVQIKVLGTALNVNNYANNKYVVVTLVKGKVAVESESEQKTLLPNQQASFNKNNGQLSVNNVHDMMEFVAWKDGLFVFENKSFAHILNSLAQWYDVEIVYRDIQPELLGHFSLNIDRSESIQNILAMLHQITGIKYTLQEKKIYLYK